MTLEEKRAYVLKFCEQQDCCSCPCKWVCHKTTERIDDMFVWQLDEAIREIQKCYPPRADAESENYDTVEHPQHYTSTSIECIDAMRETQGVEAVKSFCVCNAFKYLWRHNGKNGDEDIRKASWYLNKAVELMGENE